MSCSKAAHSHRVGGLRFINRPQRLLAESLYEHLQGEDGLVCRDFVACVEHVQEREVASRLEHAVLHAADGVWYQGL